ncbi:MAG TPA: hypothetical protein VIO58_08815 [Candidatus Methanoperedens sp.]
MMTVEVKLVKEMGIERIRCTCGTAVLPKDPEPELSRMVKKIATEEGAKFSIVDAWVHPGVREDYKTSSLPFVIIGGKSYPVDENVIREAIRKVKHE